MFSPLTRDAPLPVGSTFLFPAETDTIFYVKSIQPYGWSHNAAAIQEAFRGA